MEIYHKSCKCHYKVFVFAVCKTKLTNDWYVLCKISIRYPRLCRKNTFSIQNYPFLRLKLLFLTYYHVLFYTLDSTNLCRYVIEICPKIIETMEVRASYLFNFLSLAIFLLQSFVSLNVWLKFCLLQIEHILDFVMVIAFLVLNPTFFLYRDVINLTKMMCSYWLSLTFRLY